MAIEQAVHFSTGFPVGNAPCGVRSNRQINDRYWHLVLDAPAPLYYAVPGQFFHLLCPPTTGNDPYLRRPMSVYRVSPEERTIEFLYNVVGMGTRSLSRIKAGDVMSALGPLGVGFTLEADLSPHPRRGPRGGTCHDGRGRPMGAASQDQGDRRAVGSLSLGPDGA